MTTRSTGIRPIASRIAVSMLAMIQTMPRADRGTGAEVIAVDGIWNSRMTGSVGSLRSSTTVLIALDEGRGVGGMAGTLSVEMAVLLRPELAIDSAAFEQDAVRRDIDHLSLVQNQGLVAFGQR